MYIENLTILEIPGNDGFFLGRDQLIRTHTTLLQIDFDREKTTISLIQPYFSSLIFLPGRTREPWRFLIYASISASTGVFNLSYISLQLIREFSVQ